MHNYPLPHSPLHGQQQKVPSIDHFSPLLLYHLYSTKASSKATTTWDFCTTIALPSLLPSLHHRTNLSSSSLDWIQIAKQDPVALPYETTSPSPPFSVSCV
ncbi:hypothetical protein AAC387_Pa07g2127 [Persea americana]